MINSTSTSSHFASTNELRIARTIVLSLFIVTGIPGNFLVCFLVYRTHRLRTVTNVIISNLAVADLGVCLLNIPIALATVIRGVRLKGALCQFAGFTNSLFFFEVLLSLPLVSVSRYWCIVRPAEFTTVFSKRRTYHMIAATWMVSILCAIPPFFGWSKFNFQEGKGTCALDTQRNTDSLTYTISILVIVGFLIPFTLITVPYYKVFRFIRTHTRRMSQKRMPSFRRSRPNSMFQDFKVTKLLLVVVCVFVACWTPNIVVSLVKSFYDLNQSTQKKLDTISILLIFLSSTCNPFIYGLMNTQFRKGFLDILCAPCRKGMLGSGSVRNRGHVEDSGCCYRYRREEINLAIEVRVHGEVQYESYV